MFFLSFMVIYNHADDTLYRQIFALHWLAANIENENLQSVMHKCNSLMQAVPLQMGKYSLKSTYTLREIMRVAFS